MTTLADINKTLQQQVELLVQQGKSIDKTNKGIDSLKNKIADVLTDRKQDRLDELEAQREDKVKKAKVEARPSGLLSGLAQGTGVSWLGDFIGGVFGSLLGKGGSLLGLLTGAIGLAAGKLLVWGTIGTLIANFFGDEIKAFAEKFKEITGIDINAELEKTGYKEEILAAVTVALGALTLGVTKALTKLTGRALLNLGSAGLGMIGFGPKAAGAAAAPKQSKGRTSRPPPGSTKPTTSPKRTVVRPGQQSSGIPKTTPLPKGFTRNSAGQIIDAATGKYAKASDVVSAIEKAGKFAKYGKLLKFLGAAGAVIPALVDPAYAIYTEQSPEVVRKELIGALGSVSGAYLGGLVGGAAGGVAGSAVPGIGNAVLGFGGALVGGIAGAVAGETIAEELANFLLGTETPKKTSALDAEKLNAAANEFAGYDSMGNYVGDLSTAQPEVSQSMQNRRNIGGDKLNIGSQSASSVKPIPSPSGRVLTDSRVLNTRPSTVMTNNGNKITTTTTNQSVVNYGNASHNPYDRDRQFGGYSIR